MQLGLTRGYVSSQAYATNVKNAPIRTDPRSTSQLDAESFQPAYEWLGCHPRKLVFDLLTECVNDKSITVDMFAYDFDKPDILKMCEYRWDRGCASSWITLAAHGNRAGSTGSHATAEIRGRGQREAGDTSTLRHDKIVIQKKDGKATKVLTGSADFWVRGLYVQANNVLLFDDPKVANACRADF